MNRREALKAALALPLVGLVPAVSKREEPLTHRGPVTLENNALVAKPGMTCISGWDCNTDYDGFLRLASLGILFKNCRFRIKGPFLGVPFPLRDGSTFQGCVVSGDGSGWPA